MVTKLGGKAPSEEVIGAIRRIREQFGTAFFLYDAASIRDQHHKLVSAFDGLPFQQFFAVKALPNPAVLKILQQLGSGFDCASPFEIEMVQSIKGQPFIFTSNNTLADHFDLAVEAGGILTIDDIRLLDRVPADVQTLGLRVSFGASNPDSIVGGERSKFGMTPDQALQAASRLLANGRGSIWLHCMETANTTDTLPKIREAKQLIAFARQLTATTGLVVSGLNFGGGLGIPYVDGEGVFDVAAYATSIRSDLADDPDWAPTVAMECGRFVTGPSGYLAARVTGVYEKPHAVIGLDVSTAAMPRVSIYSNAYHHISFPGASSKAKHPTDVVGAMCESSDKFCVARELPTPELDDLCLIHDVGAHCVGMSNTYNGMLRPAEFLLDGDSLQMISRAEEPQDLMRRFTQSEIIKETENA